MYQNKGRQGRLVRYRRRILNGVDEILGRYGHIHGLPRDFSGSWMRGNPPTDTVVKKLAFRLHVLVTTHRFEVAAATAHDPARQRQLQNGEVLFSVGVWYLSVIDAKTRLFAVQ